LITGKEFFLKQPSNCLPAGVIFAISLAVPAEVGEGVRLRSRAREKGQSWVNLRVLQRETTRDFLLLQS
jgi:hypothetical protein